VFALTAGQDKTINAYQVSEAGAGQMKISENPDYTLLGHGDNVCALDAGPGGSYIVSGSWDK
jgi:phospholipase A-2-activating protein